MPLAGRSLRPSQVPPRPLPPGLRAGVEQMSGLSLADVRVHHGSDQAAQAAAHAVTSGTEIHLAPGQERHLAHEAWHVVQQSQGRVPPRTRVNGVPVNDDPHLEHEADVMGARASGASPPARPAGAPTSPAAAPASPAVVQRVAVRSDELKIDRTGPEPAVLIWSDREKGFVRNTEGSTEGYREQAEAALGPLAPLRILSIRGVIPPPRGNANPFVRSHLISAEFGGQRKYPPAENVRFHSSELEYGEWQDAESHVKNKGNRGYIYARSSESGDAREMADVIVGLVQRYLAPDQATALWKELATQTLRAANFVPIAVSFRYLDFDDKSADLDKEWDDQDSRLRVDPAIGPGAVFGALNDLGLLTKFGIQIPGELQAAAAPPTQAINSRAALISLLKSAKFRDNRRAETALNGLNKKKAIPQARFDDDAFANELKKLPEFNQKNLTIQVTGGFRSWYGADLTRADLA